MPEKKIAFDTFLNQFRHLSKIPELEYLTDITFLSALPQNRGMEKRFKGGVFLWGAWALFKCCTSRLKINADNKNYFTDRKFAVFILPTNAHEGSLRPIIDDIDSNELAIYGQSPSWQPCTPYVDLSLKANLANIALNSRINALFISLVNLVRVANIIRKIPRLRQVANPDYFCRLAELFFRMELTRSRLSKYPCRHSAIFVTYEVIPECKALVEWAIQSKKKVFHVMHGQRLSTYQITRATDLLLLGKPDEQWFRARVSPSTRIWTNGHPRLEWISKIVCSSPSSETKYKPKVAFFSQPAEKDYTREMRIDDWQILLGLKDRVDVRFRLHPREDRNVAFEDFRKIGLDFVEISEAGLAEDLAWCDGIASSWSTVSVEAASCGKAVFWTCAKPELYDAPQELRAHHVGVLIRSITDWEPWLKQFSHSGWPAPASITNSQAQELGFIGEFKRSWIERLDLA